MEIIDATGIHYLFSGDVWAGELADAVSELCHGSVILRTSKEPHVGIGQVFWYRQGFAVWPYKCTCTASHLVPTKKDEKR